MLNALEKIKEHDPSSAMLSPDDSGFSEVGVWHLPLKSYDKKKTEDLKDACCFGVSIIVSPRLLLCGILGQVVYR